MQRTVRRSLSSISVLLVLTPPSPSQSSLVRQPSITGNPGKSVDSLLRLMTVEEKLGQLAQYRGRWSDTGPKVMEGGEEQIRKGMVGSFLGIYGADYTRRMQEIAVKESRLGIPLLFAHDVIHGFRTVTPIPLAEAATWDPELVERSARMAATEATAHGLHWTFAPMVDIARDPRWGRIMEGSGEDPYLGSVMAAARVRGFQGVDLTDHATMLACAKHFAAYGGAEGGRDYNTVDVSERTLREIYLPPFRAAVEAGVRTIMAAFNEISGTPMHAHKELINGTLRGEWGFDGLVVSDYTGILELLQHGIGATRADAGIRAIEAGVDVDMVSSIYVEDLPAEVRGGRLDVAVVDEAVRRVLRVKYELGLFDDPYRYSDENRQKEMTLRPEFRALAREVASKSVTLLKNEGRLLPIDPRGKTIAVIGPLAEDSASSLGGWAGIGRPGDAVTVLEGIRKGVPGSARVVYARGGEVLKGDRSGIEEAVMTAISSDAIILVLGESRDMSGEANNRSSLDLPGVQQELADAVLGTGKPVVAVIMGGRPLSISSLAKDVPAILQTWFLGVETGNAVADVLFGKVNPGGKLPVTIPRNVGQVALYYNHKNTGRPPSEREKYTSKYLDVSWTPLYPFGYGLSYTSFEYGELVLSSSRIGPADSLVAGVRVINTGERFGEEVVQVYLRDDAASFTRPVKELKRFRRIRLRPGESKEVSFVLRRDDLEFYGEDLAKTVEPGFFTLFVGGSSVDTKETRFEYVE